MMLSSPKNNAWLVHFAFVMRAMPVQSDQAPQYAASEKKPKTKKENCQGELKTGKLCLYNYRSSIWLSSLGEAPLALQVLSQEEGDGIQVQLTLKKPLVKTDSYIYL
ncbi:short-chain enoyl-CoA hydratase [Histoplasma capsulatum G186AR]|uniref:Short-chain enoyl-CoA hydratase n=1 Tax=Ajellomyces capsulatus TaxID=5037 RepID=A0A8H7Z9Z2_AJECA|nr:short-chain enoyl-CoA hydratase [Histoplasma capsulatum]QSS76443.1 short-chain enoyl-CoA hydratase [Histoplasma capsulatum G186AR]